MGRARVKLKFQHSVEDLRAQYQKASTAVERRRSQVIWLLAEGKEIEEVKRLTAYSHPSVLEAIHRYNQEGIEGLKDGRSDNPGAPTLLSDPEILLLAQTIRQDFKRGKVWRGEDVLKWAKDKCSKELHSPRAYELLSAIGMSLQKPRPNHVNYNPSAVEEFKKKTSPRLSKQLKRLLMKSRSGPVTNTV